ncbi:MAG: non-ribosomal peptide synthetase, partial [Chloroflexota bacterium]
DDASLRAALTMETERPFDLAGGPLMRVRLFRRTSQDHVLLLCAHHSITDFWSLTLFADELGQLYGGRRQLPPLRASYGDYARWKRAQTDRGEWQEDWRYWQAQLAGAPLLELPTDRPRPPAPAFSGGTLPFHINPELREQLELLGRANHTTLFSTLLAAYAALLHRYSLAEDLVIGIPAAGRPHAEFADVLGYFVNPLAIRSRPRFELSFTTFLADVRQTVLDAIAHEGVPFPLLVQRLQPDREASRSPLFQTMFALQQRPIESPSPWSTLAALADGVRAVSEGLAFESIAVARQSSQFDLSLMLTDIGGPLSGTFTFNADTFDRATIERLAAHFRVLLEGVVSNPESAIGCLPLLTRVEQQTMLFGWNDTAAAIPDVCVHQLFEDQVERTPHALALTFEDQQLTYRQLNTRADQLARHLQSLGVRPEMPVAICLPRSPDAIVGLLGILKAGGTYVPLDPDDPMQRLDWILQDAAPPVLVTSQAICDRLPHACPRVVCLDADWPAIEALSAAPVASSVAADNLAYIIFTSGSSGKPKGVMIEHRSLVNYLMAIADISGARAGSSMPVHTPFSFDLGVTSIFMPLLTGGRAVLAPRGTGVAPLVRLLETQKFGTVKLTPSHVQALSSVIPAHAASASDTLLLGGESLSAETLAFWRQNAPDTVVINEYGPTEATIAC